MRRFGSIHKDFGAWSNRGVVLYDLGRGEEAVEAYNMAIGIIKPTLYDSWENKAIALNALGETKEAHETLSKLIFMRQKDLREAAASMSKNQEQYLDDVDRWTGSNEGNYLSDNYSPSMTEYCDNEVRVSHQGYGHVTSELAESRRELVTRLERLEQFATELAEKPR